MSTHAQRSATQARSVLVVEDDSTIVGNLVEYLESRGWRVDSAHDGAAAIARVTADTYDVIVLDLGLPRADGHAVLRHLRHTLGRATPVLVLTARDALSSKVESFNLGADDYLTKPFSTGELLARLRAALRNAAWRAAHTEAVLSFGALQIDRARRLVTLADQEVKLTPTEYQLLTLLAGSAGKVLTHQHILTTIWGPGAAQDVPTLRVFIAQLRRKIEPSPAQPVYIRNEPGIGYRFLAEPS